MQQTKIVLIAHNVRSTHNIGSLIRTANGLGVHAIYCTGYTPYPAQQEDQRLPHIQRKITQQIDKTALGAQDAIPIYHKADISAAFEALRRQGYVIAALEQSAASIPLPSFQPPQKVAIIVGREVEGIEPEVLARCDVSLEIPMFGTKESFNVSVAGGIALYHCRFGRNPA